MDKIKEYLLSKQDIKYRDFTLPLIPNVDEKTFNEAIEKLNSALKYVKTYYAFGGLTMFYERELIGDENLKDVIRRMILHLEAGHFFLHHCLLGSNNDGDSGSTDNSDVCDITESSDEEVA